MAYAASGEPTPALLGFCKKNGVTGEGGYTLLGACTPHGCSPCPPWAMPTWLGQAGRRRGLVCQAAPGSILSRVQLASAFEGPGSSGNVAAAPWPLRPVPLPLASPPAVEDCFAEADAKGVEYVWAEVKQVGDAPCGATERSCPANVPPWRLCVMQCLRSLLLAMFC